MSQLNHDDGNCICKTCSCGKHKLCKPAWSSGPKFDGHSEYCENYKNYPQNQIFKGKSAAPVLIPMAGGEFSTSTESSERYIKHVMLPSVSAKKPEIALRGGSFETETTQRHDFPGWPAANRAISQKPPQHAWSTEKGQFDDTTTHGKDYRQFPIPPRFQRPQAEYVKSFVPFNGISTQVEDYKRWDIKGAAKKRPDAIAHMNIRDDRSFKSTCADSYVVHQSTRILAKKVYDTPVSEKFVATTTSKEAYTIMPLPKKHQIEKPIYIYNDTPINTKTEYNDRFVTKIASRYVHVMPGYIENNSKFEAKSTHKTDFNTPKMTKVQDYSPKNKYIPISDSRDFITTSAGDLKAKLLPECAASKWMKQNREIHTDGHVYLAKA